MHRIAPKAISPNSDCKRNRMRAKHLTLGASILALGLVACSSQALPLDDIVLPNGFQIDLYATDVPDARSLVLGDQGTVFVSTRKRGELYALRDTNGDQRADERILLAQNLNTPN